MCKTTAGNCYETFCTNFLHKSAHHSSFPLLILVHRITLKLISRSCYTRHRTFEDFTHYKNCTPFFFVCVILHFPLCETVVSRQEGLGTRVVRPDTSLGWPHTHILPTFSACFSVNSCCKTSTEKLGSDV